MEDFNWKFQEENERYVCEMPDGVSLVAKFTGERSKAWYVWSKHKRAPLVSGGTHGTIDYAQGKAEGAYLGLKATGRIK